jgi:spectinomycin phosphotransferase
MIENQFLSSQKIVEALRKSYGIEVEDLEFLPLGADRNATVYKAQAKDKKDYFVKLKRDYDRKIGLAITKLLYEAGIRQMILPIPTLQGEPTAHLEDSTLIVYPFIVGQDGFSRDLSQEQWTALGVALKKIHEVKLPLSLQEQIRKEAYSDIWRNAVKKLLRDVDAAREANSFYQFLSSKKEIIRKLIVGAEVLSQKIRNLPVEFVLCHADIHGGNVLIGESNAIYIVDWDDPMMAPKERDLMFIGGGVGNMWNKPHEEDHFYEGYGHVQINKEILSYYRLERIVEDIADFSIQLHSASIADADKQTIYKLFTGMFDQNGVVDIALKSDLDIQSK